MINANTHTHTEIIRVGANEYVVAKAFAAEAARGGAGAPPPPQIGKGGKLVPVGQDDEALIEKVKAKLWKLLSHHEKGMPSADLHNAFQSMFKEPIPFSHMFR